MNTLKVLEKEIRRMQVYRGRQSPATISKDTPGAKSSTRYAAEGEDRRRFVPPPATTGRYRHNATAKHAIESPLDTPFDPGLAGRQTPLSGRCWLIQSQIYGAPNGDLMAVKLG